MPIARPFTTSGAPGVRAGGWDALKSAAAISIAVFFVKNMEPAVS